MLNKLKFFLTGLRDDPRFPKNDQKILLALIILVLSPLDFIPDWHKYTGLLDDFFYLAIICDYLFDVIDQEIILSHYPFGMKSYSKIRNFGRFLSNFAPSFITHKVWSFKKNPFN